MQERMNQIVVHEAGRQMDSIRSDPFMAQEEGEGCVPGQAGREGGRRRDAPEERRAISYTYTGEKGRGGKARDARRARGRRRRRRRGEGARPNHPKQPGGTKEDEDVGPASPSFLPCYAGLVWAGPAWTLPRTEYSISSSFGENIPSPHHLESEN